MINQEETDSFNKHKSANSQILFSPTFEKAVEESPA
jgi:hypothetical protein